MSVKSKILLIILTITFMACGREEFGSVPKSEDIKTDPLKTYTHKACTEQTLIRPKVDILYVVDNSQSTYYLSSDIKNSLSKTVTSLSTQFDYRVIGTPLIETANGNNDFQVMTNSIDLQGIPNDARRISSTNGFSFFSNQPASGVEKGLDRIVTFINTHQNQLIRKNSHLIVVLISNGRDLEVEEDAGYGNGETKLNKEIYDSRLATFNHLKTQLESLQLRMISITAKSVCGNGFRTALKSYVKMSQDLYTLSGASDNPAHQDSYDLCSSSGISSVFSSINDSIKQIILPHQYRYWPISLAENDPLFSIDKIEVTKISSSNVNTKLIRGTDWQYEDKGSVTSVNTRELPTPGEPVNGRHFIRFTNLVSYPNCVLVTSVSRTEYFGYIVLPQKPKVESVSVRINGNIVPKSMTNGWSDQTSTVQTRNIKVPHPNPGDENPPLIRTGFMLKLNGSNNYYKSGDDVQVNFIPAGI